MLRYHNNPEATRVTLDADGFLHTGDVARVDGDGYTYIVDRVKELIKYKGYPVAPAELEGLLLTHPDIADAAVIGLPDDVCGELPRAYVVLKPHRSGVQPHDIESFIERSVAPHKRLRGGVRIVDAIPKSASGKLLRRVLRDQAKAEARTPAP